MILTTFNSHIVSLRAWLCSHASLHDCARWFEINRYKSGYSSGLDILWNSSLQLHLAHHPTRYTGGNPFYFLWYFYRCCHYSMKSKLIIHPSVLREDTMSSVRNILQTTSACHSETWSLAHFKTLLILWNSGKRGKMMLVVVGEGGTEKGAMYFWWNSNQSIKGVRTPCNPSLDPHLLHELKRNQSKWYKVSGNRSIDLKLKTCCTTNLATLAPSMPLRIPARNWILGLLYEWFT